MSNMKQNIDKIIKWFDMKKISVIICILFIISMLPIWYLAFYARPSGDDYGYSANSHRAWIATHSLIEVLKASAQTTNSMLQTWNGDWVTVFLFTLMPEVFIPYSFWVVPLFMTGIVILATIYFGNEILSVKLGMKWYESLMIVSIALFISYQFIPSTAIGMYWYVGAMHYMMPHAVALMLLGFLSKFSRTNKIKYVVYSVIGTVIIGGSSYFSTLVVFMIYFMVMLLGVKKNKKILLMILPFITGSIALVAQIIMPGNAARGGNEFGFSFFRIMQTIIQSLIQGFIRIGNYFVDKRFIFILFLIVAILSWECLSKVEKIYNFQWPGVFILFMYALYAATFAPELYVTVEVSLGPATMQYFTFVLAAVASIIYIEGWIISKMREKGAIKRVWDEMGYRKKIVIPIVLLCTIVVILNRGMLSNSVFNRAYEYVASGQADDFKEQITSQMEILMDDTIKEAYLCPINDNQGPLMHMPVTEDPEAFTNRVVANFYGKDKVIMQYEEK